MLKNKALGKDKINWGYQPKLRLNCYFQLFAGQIIRICWTFPFTQKISLSTFCESSPISDSGDIQLTTHNFSFHGFRQAMEMKTNVKKCQYAFFLNCVKRDKEE